MSWYSKVFGGLVGGEVKAAGEGVGIALGSASGLVKSLSIAIRGRDPEKEAEIELQLVELEKMISQAQTQINLVEAASGSVLVAGWRPAIGWVCAFALALYYPTRIIVGMAFWVYFTLKAAQMQPLPEVGIADVLGLVATMLGSSGLRTVEKKLGVQGDH